LTVSPTEPTVLRPLRDRDCDCDRDRVCERGFVAFDDDRPREELLLLDELRELAVDLRPFLLVCRDFDPLLVPFRVVLLERLDVRRLPVFDFACAIFSFSSVFHSEQTRLPFQVVGSYPR
jgi:hypothetical protein